MFGVERTLLVFKFSLLNIGKVWCFISFWIFSNKVKDKGRARARDKVTSMNMTVDLDTDPQTDPRESCRSGSPLNALISDQMERLKPLNQAKNSVHLRSVL